MRRKNKIKEKWKSFKKIEDRIYQISNLGNIRKINNNKNTVKELKGSILRNQYKQLIIQGKHYYVHRLVAQAFIPNPYHFPIVNHIDGNKSNNCANNLEWCTYSYNEKEAYRLRLKEPKKGNQILQYNKNGVLLKEWNNLKQIYLDKGYHTGNIIEVCQFKRKTANGYIWRYLK